MSILNKLARNVTAGDLQRPFGPVLSIDMSGEEAHDQMWDAPYSPAPYHRELDEQFDRICLVRGPSQQLTHHVWGMRLDVEHPVAEFAEEIRPSDCVTDATPALTLMQLLLDESRPYRLVLTETRLSGFVSCADLFRPEMRVCVLALLLDVEQKCAELLTWGAGDAEGAFARLSAGRQQKAREICARAFPKSAGPEWAEQAEELVYATTFADKATMIGPLDPFASIPRRQLERDFARMERTRNALAHTRLEQRGELKELAEVIGIAEEVLRRIAPATEQPRLRLVVPKRTEST